MSVDLSTIVVIDVESTCWENDQDQTRTSSEIIEFGVCPVHVHSGVAVGLAESFLVKPVRSEVSEFCTKLTTITPEMLSTAKPYAVVAREIMAAYKTQHRVVATWGDYDRNMFQKHHDKWLDPYIMGPTHWNVKSMFAVTHDLRKGVSVPAALAMLNLPFDGTLHRGVDDARNIARILRHLVERMRT